MYKKGDEIKQKNNNNMFLLLKKYLTINFLFITIT